MMRLYSDETERQRELQIKYGPSCGIARRGPVWTGDSYRCSACEARVEYARDGSIRPIGGGA
jgi:hypothetical protein